MRSKQLLLVQENHATSKLDSSVIRFTVKSYSESRIKLRNLQILKNSAENVKSVPKSLDVRVEKIRMENLLLRSTPKAIWFEFWMK